MTPAPAPAPSRPAGRLWFLAAALLALPLCVDAVSDPDIWWHLRTGRWIADNLAVPHTELFSYTAHGAPNVTHEWLAQLAFWLVDSGAGLTVLALLVGAVTWSGLLALALVARDRGAGGFACGVALLLGAKAMQPVTGTRPQMLTFALLCWTLLILDRHVRRGGRRAWLLVPLFLLWANLHAGFVIGLAVLSVALLAHLLDARQAGRLDRTLWRRAAVAAAALLASAAVALINPDGAGLYAWAVQGSAPGAHQLIQEWQRPDLTSLDMLPLALLLLATAASMVASRRRLRPSHVVLGLLGAAAAMVAVRNIALAVALLSPTLAELLPLRYALPARPALLPALAATAAALLLVAATAQLAATASASGVATRYPVCLVADVTSAGQQVRLWLPYGEAGYALEAGWPQLSVYAYGNDAALGPAIVAAEVRIAAGTTVAPTALTLLGQSGTNAVITPGGSLASELAGAGWRTVASARGEHLLVAPGLLGAQALPCAQS